MYSHFLIVIPVIMMTVSMTAPPRLKENHSNKLNLVMRAGAGQQHQETICLCDVWERECRHCSHDSSALLHPPTRGWHTPATGPHVIQRATATQVAGVLYIAKTSSWLLEVPRNGRQKCAISAKDREEAPPLLLRDFITSWMTEGGGIFQL